MLAVALVISHLAAALRRETEVAQLNEGRARQLQELATALASATRSEEVSHQAQKRPGRTPSPVRAVIAVLERGAIDAPPALRDGMLCCMREARDAGARHRPLAGPERLVPAAASQGAISGAACVQNVSARDNGGREHAQAICALVGQALWRCGCRLGHAAEEQSQRHKAQNTFLAAISHDFRTPLATIVGAASHCRRSATSCRRRNRSAC